MLFPLLYFFPCYPLFLPFPLAPLTSPFLSSSLHILDKINRNANIALKRIIISFFNLRLFAILLPCLLFSLLPFSSLSSYTFQLLRSTPSLHLISSFFHFSLFPLIISPFFLHPFPLSYSNALSLFSHQSSSYLPSSLPLSPFFPPLNPPIYLSHSTLSLLTPYL